jgi:hypothetical protein
MSATMLLADAWILPATHPQSHPCPLLSQHKPGLTSLLMSVCSLLLQHAAAGHSSSNYVETQ